MKAYNQMVEILDRAAEFYARSPDGQYDEVVSVLIDEIYRLPTDVREELINTLHARLRARGYVNK